MPANREKNYLNILLTPLAECAQYKPAFGKAESDGIDLKQFKSIYGKDPLYHWVGLDSELMYAAHKAAGGMTSIYRQLGIGCERLLRQIIQDSLRLSEKQVAWSYDYDKGDGKTATHTLDACIRIADIKDLSRKKILLAWLHRIAADMQIPEKNIKKLTGAAFEIRQGYKSADSKRQNADLRFGLRAYADASFLPVIAIVSTQVSDVVIRRYSDARLYVMLGTTAGQNSTFRFFSDVIGYDLAGFFKNASPMIRVKFETIIQQLLKP